MTTLLAYYYEKSPSLRNLTLEKFSIYEFLENALGKLQLYQVPYLRIVGKRINGLICLNN